MTVLVKTLTLSMFLGFATSSYAADEKKADGNDSCGVKGTIEDRIKDCAEKFKDSREIKTTVVIKNEVDGWWDKIKSYFTDTDKSEETWLLVSKDSMRSFWTTDNKKSIWSTPSDKKLKFDTVKEYCSKISLTNGESKLTFNLPNQTKIESSYKAGLGIAISELKDIHVWATKKDDKKKFGIFDIAKLTFKTDDKAESKALCLSMIESN